ncbi:MAG: Gfo/Idh/MocA family oxidoreductase [Anaerolineae bacterium]
MPLRVAIAGTGLITRVHARAIQNLPDVVLEAVVNHRPESMADFSAEFQIRRQYTSLPNLLKDGGIDALVICTPNYLHAPQSIAALEAGVHVMVEKPMAMTPAEAEMMVAASRQSGALLMVAHCWRFSPEVRWLRDQVTAGRLGEIVRTKGYCSHVNGGPGGWFTHKELAGGGATIDMAIHALDTVRFLLGDPQPVNVYARIGTYYGNFDVDDTSLLIVNWDQGTTSYIEAGWWQPHSDEPQAATQVYGTAGFGRVFPTYIEIPDADRSEMQRIDSGLPPVDEAPRRERFNIQMAHFVTCIREGRQPSPDGVDGWLNMRVIEAAYKSAETGQVVSL